MTEDKTGSVAEEAAKLFAALNRGGDRQETAHAGPDCQWCPVCQVIFRVRQASPEAVEHLTTAAAGVLGAVRSFLEAAAAAAEKSGTTNTEDDTAEPPTVDRIDVSEDPERWD
jgi:hypothetical protein